MSETSVTVDSVLDLCQHQHRRIVLAILTTEQQPLTLDDLTKTIFKYNHQIPIADVTEDAITDIQISLYHSHLPKLAEEGLITFDPERQLVKPTKQLEQVTPTLSAILDADPTLNVPLEL